MAAGAPSTGGDQVSLMAGPSAGRIRARFAGGWSLSTTGVELGAGDGISAGRVRLLEGPPSEAPVLDGCREWCREAVLSEELGSVGSGGEWWGEGPGYELEFGGELD
jgi:hypothetical protein